MTLPDMSNTALHARALAETAPDPIITIDEASTILYVNAGAERMFGYSAREMVGQPLTMLIPERLRERHVNGVRHYVETGHRRISWQGLRVSACTKAGVEIPVEIAFGEFEWNGRRVFSGFIRDMSVRVANEEALAAANARLQQQALELEAQIEAAQTLARELEQAHGYAEVRARLAARSADRARRLLTLSTALNKALGTAQVADLILDTGIAAVGADAGSFALISYGERGPGEFELIRARGVRAEFWADYKQFALHPGRPMSDAVLTRAPVLVQSREDARIRYPTIADVGYEAFAALPVLSGDSAIAAIGFSFVRPQQFDEPTETFLRTVGELCAQALERAQLHDESDRHAQQSSFLAEASRVLSSSLDYEATLKSMAQAAVPTLADWCIVDVVDDPTSDAWPPKLTRLAVAHKDPAKKAIAMSLSAQTPTDWDSQSGLAEALRHGESHLVPMVTDEMRDGRVRTGEHLAILRELGYTSVIVVPLLARGHRLGVLTLLMSDSGRRYDKDDVSLATDLAARAATAIDNARLFRDAQHARTVAEDAMTRADSASRAKSNFLATMSHEIRTPINAVLGYAELLEMELAGPLTAEQHAQLARIRSSTGHLLTLVSEVLDLAKIESGTLRVNVAESIAGETANAALGLVSPLALAKGVSISEACEGECGARYVGDADRVRQILANLIANAVKFTKPGGTVSLSCSVVTEPPMTGVLERGEPYVAFNVSDTGVGIPADELETIFEAFVQADSKNRSPYTREQSGTGLGLAISRRLANRMGGEITVQSQPGVGSIFTLFMPAV